LADGAGRATGPGVILICQREQALFGEGISFVGNRADDQSPLSQILVVHIYTNSKET
jgi:hypothetical protein